MKLYYAPGACSLGPHIALREADRTFDLERVDLKMHRNALGDDFLAVNPKGYVPALQLDGDHSDVLTENVAILTYIADLAPEAHLIPPAGTFARYHHLEWLAFISTELHKQFSPLFGSATPVATQETERAKIGQRLMWLQDHFEDRPFLMGETMTVADIYLFVMLTWCERFHIDVLLWPNLEDFYHRVRDRHSVEEAMTAEGLIGRRAA